MSANREFRLGFEIGALRGILGGRKRAEQKEDGTGTQQGVARGGIGRRRRVLAIEQNDFADRHLVAGLEGLFGHPHSVDIGAGRAAAVGEAVPARGRANHAVLGGDARFGQAYVGGRGVPNRDLAISEREPRAEERSADDDEFGVHFRL